MVQITLREALASPSVKCTRGRLSCTRGSLPRVQHSGKTARGISSRERRLSREPKIIHSGMAFPRAVLALGEELTPLVVAGAVYLFFFKKNLPRVQHSGKTPSSPRAAAQALGEDSLFPESCSPSTRGRQLLPREPLPRHSGKAPSSPRAKACALGKATLKILFFAFSFNQLYIYHNPKINSNISQTTFIYITNDQIYTKFKIYYKPHVQEYILFQVHKFNT